MSLNTGTEMYLNLGAGTVPLLLPTRVSGYCSYSVWPELQLLIVDWNKLALGDDRHLSGILADYLQDHRERLLATATGPVDRGGRLDELIQYLRAVFQAVQQVPAPGPG